MPTSEFDERERAIKALQAKAKAKGEPSGWFEPLYQAARRGELQVPWDDGAPNPHLVEWLRSEHINGHGKRALEVGCGLGYGARALAACGFDVTAVDLSPTAVDQARALHDHDRISFQQCDLLEPPDEFLKAFDLVVEIYTLQAIPAAQREVLTKVLPKLIAKGGQMLVIARARDEEQTVKGPPWPLTEAEIRALAPPRSGVKLVTLERFFDQEKPSKERFRALFQRS